MATLTNTDEKKRNCFPLSWKTKL